MKKIYKYAFTGLLVLGLSACSKLEDFGDTNKNPAATTEPIIGALMTNALSALPAYASQTTPGLYGQYFAETQYTDVSLYSFQQLSFAGDYTGALYDLQNIIGLKQSNNMAQVSKIVQQYIYWTITDRWGDVPYSEALNAVQNPKPKYDKQEDIYKGMILALKTAVASFDSSPITGDIIFGGDVALWKRTANSLRMLMALQLSKTSAKTYAAAEFVSAMNDPAGYISTNAANFDITFPGDNFKTTWWNRYNGRKDFGESKTMTDLMGSLGDTRQAAYGGSSEQEGGEGTSSIGIPYGTSRAKAEAFTAANPTWARVLRGDFRRAAGTVTIISAAQVALARAEAADLGWTTENVQTVYNAGIDLSFAQWGITVPTTYKTQSSVVLTAPAGTEANLAKIATQQYIASYPDGLRGWDIWRKTGYPVLSPAPDATNTTDGKQIPVRIAYATYEYTTNPTKVAEAVARIAGGKDVQTAKVWWDQ